MNFGLLPNMYDLVMSSQFNDTITKCNKGIFLARILRSKMYKLHRLVMMEPNFHRNPQLIPYMQRLNDEVRECYEQLEILVKKLPSEVPPSDNLNNMKLLYGSELLTHDVENPHMREGVLEGMIDAGNWNEGQYQIFFYLTEFLRSNRRRTSSLYKKPLQLSNYTVLGNPHTQFVKAYQGMKKEIKTKGYGIFPRVLADDGASMAMEFKIGVSSSDKNDKQIVCYLKMLLTEVYGNLEFINVIAPHEDWHYEDVSGEKRLMATHPSRYIVYQKMTRQANVHLQAIVSHPTRWNSVNLVQLVHVFAKMREIFEARCKLCRKTLRNFLPPLIFEMRNPKESAYHEACK